MISLTYTRDEWVINNFRTQLSMRPMYIELWKEKESDREMLPMMSPFVACHAAAMRQQTVRRTTTVWVNNRRLNKSLSIHLHLTACKSNHKAHIHSRTHSHSHTHTCIKLKIHICIQICKTTCRYTCQIALSFGLSTVRMKINQQTAMSVDLLPGRDCSTCVRPVELSTDFNCRMKATNLIFNQQKEIISN